MQRKPQGVTDRPHATTCFPSPLPITIILIFLFTLPPPFRILLQTSPPAPPSPTPHSAPTPLPSRKSMQSSTIPTAFQSAQPSQFLQPLLHNIRKSPQVFTIFYSHDNASSLPMMQSPWAQQPWQVSIAQERLNLNPQKRLNFYFQPAPKKSLVFPSGVQPP